MLKELALYVVSNVGTAVRRNRLKSTISAGSINTIQCNLHYLENAYPLFVISKYDISVGWQLRFGKSVHVADAGFIKCITFKQPEFTDKIREKAVAPAKDASDLRRLSLFFNSFPLKD